MHSTPDTKLSSKRLVWGLFGWMIILGLNYGCQTPVYVTETSSELANFEKILVVPFQDMTRIPGNDVDTRCPVCGRVFISGEVADNATDFLTAQTTALLKRHSAYQLVFEGLTDSSMDHLYSANPTANGSRQAFVEKGRENNADVVLLGLVYRFKERVGTGYSVELPASVAFGMHLIRVTDGRTLWSAHFDETQKALGDNLFQLGSFLSRGGRWVTVEELATSGLEEIFKKFPQK
jgi:TolB-like protein